VTGQKISIRCADCGQRALVWPDVRWCEHCLAQRHGAICEQPYGHDGPCDAWPWEPP
jgi:hypothetical protein